MPSTRRTFLSTMAAIPLTSGVVAGESTGEPTVDWTTDMDTGEFIDSARLDGETLVLSESPDEYGVVSTLDENGTVTEFTRIKLERDWEWLTPREDGSIIVAGFSSSSELHVHHVGADRALGWQHAVPVGEYDIENRGHALGDGRVGVVSHYDTPSTPASLRLHVLDPDGEIHREWDRDQSYGRATVTGDGELLIGGRTYRDGTTGWMARFDTSGQKRWERTWHDSDYVYDEVAFDSSGGIHFCSFRDRDRLLARDISADGEVRNEWTFRLDGRPRATERLADGSAAIVTNGHDSSPRLHRTFPDGSVDSYDLQLYRWGTEVHELYATTNGYVFTGNTHPTSGETGRVVTLTYDDGSTEATETAADSDTSDPAETPANQSTTEPAASAAAVNSRTRANATDAQTATSGSGAGFGVATAGAGALAASLARLIAAEDAD